MRVSATAKYVRGSTRKANLVAATIRGRPVEEAAALLRFMPQHAARDIEQVLKSATANARRIGPDGAYGAPKTTGRLIVRSRHRK